MRPQLTAITILFITAAHAQPGDRWLAQKHALGPCGARMVHEVIDLNGDKVPDLAISGMQEGTDDDPSSGGNCSRIVQPTGGAELLLRQKDGRPTGPFELGAGDSLKTAALAEGLHRQTLLWWPEPIQVLSWPHGNWRTEPTTWSKEQAAQRFVLKIPGKDGVQWCWFRILHDAETDVTSIEHGPLLEEHRTLHGKP